MKVFIAIVFVGYFSGALGHGRLMEPASRSSLWRFPEYAEFNPPVNPLDNQLFCGGLPIHYLVNGGKCGECGDPWNEPQPRANEGGGTYGRGIIARNYSQGETIEVIVELTRSHLGYFEFRLCPQNNPNVPAGQDCFDKHLLELADGSGTRYRIKRANEFLKTFQIDVKLPEDVTCEQCVFQWHYRTRDSWGRCPPGSKMLGCGDKEIFRGCSDISILPSQSHA